MKSKVHYFARSTEALKNGSFYKAHTLKVDKVNSINVCSYYVNGDFMGFGMPDSLKDYTEFTKAEAEKLIPKQLW